MRTSAVGYLFRELAAAGIRVRGGHMAMDKIPEGANVVYWDGVRWSRDADGRLHEKPTGEKVPVAWWVFEHKIGEEDDTVKKTVKGVKQLVDVTIDIFGPDWRDAVGTLVEVLDDPQNGWVFGLGVTGELRENNPGGFMQGIERFEWLECEICKESVCTYKKFGPATANRKCNATRGCTGKIRRLPLRFEVTSPKTTPKKRPKPAVTSENQGVPLHTEQAKYRNESENALDSECIARRVTTVTIEEFLGKDDGAVDRDVA